jgi:heptosyltransferase III
MNLRSIAHSVRNSILPAMARRPFRSIENPENRILLVRPDHFGDLLMLGPALQFLDEHAIGHDHFLLTGPWNRSVATHVAPDWQHHEWRFPGFDRQQTPGSGTLDAYTQIRKAADFVRELAPQAIVLTRDDHWWGAWMAREAGVPIRIGYDHPLLRPFLTHPIPIRSANYVDQNLQLARSAATILGYSVAELEPAIPDKHPLVWPIHSDAANETAQLVEAMKLGERFVVVHPGSGAEVKLWGNDRWADVINRVHRATGLSVILTGTNEEADLCAEIRRLSSPPVHNLAGQTSLFSLAELFRSASIVLGVDSGPLHLACAVGTKSVHLFGPSDAVRYGPWGNSSSHRVVSAGLTCPDCGNLSPSRQSGCGCMMAITVDQVAETAIAMLRNDE